MKRVKIDTLTRSALWSSYNHTCFYCHQPLDWDNLHIDHIIPQSKGNDFGIIQNIIEEYELDQNFDVDNVNNLVPCHAHCNRKKSDQLFTKPTTLYYLELTSKRSESILSEIQKLRNRKNKGSIVSKLQMALSTNLITTNELKSLLKSAEENDWKKSSVEIPHGVQFIDDIYDTFYFESDYEELLDKELVIFNGEGFVTLCNDQNEELRVSTLRNWQLATKKGFYPFTNNDIKQSSTFTFLEELIQAIKQARMPKVSFISEPWIELDNLDLLSPNVLHGFGDSVERFVKDGMSVGDMVSQGLVKIVDSNYYKISLQYNEFQTSFIEQFRADFTKNGIEDVFVKGWANAVGGTLGYGFTSILTRKSNDHLIERI